MNQLAEMTPAQVDELLTRARRSLKSHTSDARHEAEPEAFRGAISTILGALHEIAALHPGRATEIAAIIEAYRDQALDG